MNSPLYKLLAVLVLAFFAGAPPSWAREAAPAADNPALEKRAMDLAGKLRCLVCQNQTIAESNAPLAVDLKNQVREQLSAGRSESQIIDYMVARYGDFVLYRPPFKAITALLWLGPLILLLAGLFWLYRVLLRRRSEAAAPQLTQAQQERARALLEGHTESQ